ncbi:DNA mismatch repair endonuclease MutL [Blattabacterium cuenoti]|uniref:DNA mismatch repair endonuclease MutL n=1 Tax=Blattabacterium cuenoti TaxID=1653831 RepID=UPI00163D1C3C|nr:DNA mismatch repair endonuclease MutL [Blattabacterium cuenoti]
MTDYIQLLPQQVINKIAAGEVILRPSSVLKELLENSIDAKSNKIDIFIQDSGKTLIQLIDNGSGMSYNDAKISFQRYTTSKIKTNEDIFKINTKGFRGEALSSISIISQLEIQTKNKENKIGIHLFIEDGKIKKKIPINMLKGTRISVKNIFYKIPARRRFLKSSIIEFQHIINEFYKIILAHRNIIYRLYHNNKIIFNLKKASLKERIKEIFHKKNKKLIPFFIKEKKIFIKGFISKPDTSLKKGDQFLFVNKRCINHIIIHKNIIHSYDGILKNLKTVSYFIFIYINTKLVNYNIHPSKIEIQLELEEEENICSLIKKELKKILCDQYEIKKEDLFNNSFQTKDSFLLKNPLDEFSYKEKVIQLENWFDKTKKYNNIIDHHLINQLSHYIINETYIKTFQIIKKYIIFSWENEYIIFLDQNRAHQNILFEFFLKKKLISQPFLFPIEIKLLKNELISLKNIQYELIKIGFYFYFNNQSVYLYSIPEKIKQNILIEIIKNILKYNFIKGETKNKNKLIQSISQSAAIKYGSTLNSNQMICLMKDFFSCKNINYTYSGYPIFFVFKKKFFISEFL